MLSSSCRRNVHSDRGNGPPSSFPGNAGGTASTFLRWRVAPQDAAVFVASLYGVHVNVRFQSSPCRGAARMRLPAAAGTFFMRDERGFLLLGRGAMQVERRSSGINWVFAESCLFTPWDFGSAMSFARSWCRVFPGLTGCERAAWRRLRWRHRFAAVAPAISPADVHAVQNRDRRSTGDCRQCCVSGGPKPRDFSGSDRAFRSPHGRHPISGLGVERGDWAAGVPQQHAALGRGRWKDARMPAGYGERLLASRGAMRQLAKRQGRA